MKLDGRGAVLLTAGRKDILEALADQGPLTMPEIPRHWPFTRPMMEVMVEELVSTGVLNVSPVSRIPGQRAYAITRNGRAVLAATSATEEPMLAAG